MLPRLTRLIHENFSVVMNHAFSQPALGEMLEKNFHGEWKHLRRAVFEISEERANRALIELASLLRILDDREGLSDYLRKTKGHNFGLVYKEDGSTEELFLRDLTNKIVHAHQLVWDFSEKDNPKVICISPDPKRWQRAEIILIRFAGFCGQLMS